MNEETKRPYYEGSELREAIERWKKDCDWARAEGRPEPRKPMARAEYERERAVDEAFKAIGL